MLFRCSYCPMNTNLTLAQFPGKLYFWWEACPLLPACENKLAKDIELQRELKGLSKIARIHACECELTHKCVWLERSVDHYYSNGINKCGRVADKISSKLLHSETWFKLSPHFCCCGNVNPNLQRSDHHGNIVCVVAHLFSGRHVGCVCVCVWWSIVKYTNIRVAVNLKSYVEFTCHYIPYGNCIIKCGKKSRLNTFICNLLHEIDTFSLLGECGTNSSAHALRTISRSERSVVAMGTFTVCCLTYIFPGRVDGCVWVCVCVSFLHLLKSSKAASSMWGKNRI